MALAIIILCVSIKMFDEERPKVFMGEKKDHSYYEVIELRSIVDRYFLENQRIFK